MMVERRAVFGCPFTPASEESSDAEYVFFKGFSSKTCKAVKIISTVFSSSHDFKE